MKYSFLLFAFFSISCRIVSAQTYKIVDTDQTLMYDSLSEVPSITTGSPFYGQDAQYNCYQPWYIDNGDGTVTDINTGLMWQKTPDQDGDGNIDYDDKMSYAEALDSAANFHLGGYNDWRLPTIKEQYSLILFSGLDPSGYEGTSTDGLTPFIDTNYFGFNYGDQAAGERIIDAQFATSTLYVSTTMNGAETMFGVNFADGRIKGYPTGPMPGQTISKQFYVLFVRGNTGYAINNFHDNGDGTITDSASGLMWMQQDNAAGVRWEEALSYAENLNFASYEDWRLPNAKELQSIVDYSKSPSTTASAAIDPLFNCTPITNEAGQTDFGFYWTNTTHANWMAAGNGKNAAYISFGRAMGYMNGSWMDVHGAGSQRSDPKTGDPADYPTGLGPQGDAIRIYNYVRVVRDIYTNPGFDESGSTGSTIKIYPVPASDFIQISTNSDDVFLKVIISNTLGQTVQTQQWDDSTPQINITKLPTGVYNITLVGEKTALFATFTKQ